MNNDIQKWRRDKLGAGITLSDLAPSREEPEGSDPDEFDFGTLELGKGPSRARFHESGVPTEVALRHGESYGKSKASEDYLKARKAWRGGKVPGASAVPLDPKPELTANFRIGRTAVEGGTRTRVRLRPGFMGSLGHLDRSRFKRLVLERINGREWSKEDSAWMAEQKSKKIEKKETTRQAARRKSKEYLSRFRWTKEKKAPYRGKSWRQAPWTEIDMRKFSEDYQKIGGSGFIEEPF